MKKKKTLKEQNTPLIYSFIVLNIVIGYVFLFLTSPTLDNINGFLEKVTAKQSIFTLTIPFLALILTNLVSSNNKARIVFFRFSNPLPGSRAFTKLIFKDQRININKLKQNYSPFTIEAEKQNALWYKLYKLNIEKITVIESHKKFLLMRDLTSISFILFCFIPVVYVFIDVKWGDAIKYIGYLFLQLTLLGVSANNLGVRFTCNVLAEESNN
jgi:hypothetical protein